jgi:hypothetical protein
MKSLIILHPYAQVVVFMSLLLCIFFARYIEQLAGCYAIIFMLLLVSNQFTLHVKLLIFAIIPFFLFLFLVYVIILKNEPVGSYSSGVTYLSFLLIRITCLTSMCQWMFNVPSRYLLKFLKTVGVKGSFLIIFLSSFAVLKDFNLRADRIITARLSRGYLKSRTLFNRLLQIPFIIRPLFVSIIMLSIERAASWQQRNLLTEIDEIKVGSFVDVQFSKNLSVFFSIITSSWLIIIVYLN